MASCDAGGKGARAKRGNQVGHLAHRLDAAHLLTMARIADLKQQLSTVGDDAQLANIDLQNMLRKQQQTLQMLSNIAKMLHDTAMPIVRQE